MAIMTLCFRRPERIIPVLAFKLLNENIREFNFSGTIVALKVILLLARKLIQERPLSAEKQQNPKAS
jgi:hypothetical protein